ncbi:DHA2 family efflux MFS transporter permease subunit [Prescottella equi]|uniref:DHA2 family efflux MFS transporter permease subunit n=1 Tax=Rhodococcus hoagii TaxID=43767 RepID=UPI000A118BB3|nr:DHA2 family efflux MFS transporter permease subunit [Prescottella equi]ORM02528.1 MFS transporter [Prescottella equi]ORM19775.1 MFS transporter [Prescottella equi]QDP11008.1 DHA2 family efflux MFS transporter permease subunit [Prescottella equi]
MQKQSQKFGAVLAVLAGAPFVANLDLFVVNVALDDIAADYSGTPLSHLSWVLSGYAIVYAALLIPAGRWADRVGRRRAFLVGLALFTVASAACALAPSLWTLVAFRLVQAAGAAILTPASLGLVIAALPEARRALGVRLWAATGAAAAALGPVLGGLLVATSWRWIFLINVPIGVILLWTAARTVPESRDPHPAPVDGAGAVLLAFGVGAVSLALVQGPEWGWTHAATLAAAILGVLALVWFARRTMRHDSPLLDPALLRVRPFAWSNVTAIAFSASFAAGLLVNILWMQNQWGYSALRTGLAVAPGPMLVPLFAVIGQLLSRRIPSGTVAALGSALWGAGIVLVLAGVDATPNYAAGMLPGWIVGGAGVGLALPTILATAAATLPPALGATGSAVVNTARQLGSVLGIAILVALLASSGFTAAWWAVAALAAVGAVTALGMSPRAAERPTTAPAVTAH